MKRHDKKVSRPALGGLITGLFNGLLGAGGGMIAIPFLSKSIEPKKAHATCVAVILPMCISSALSYISSGAVSISDATPYIAWGLIGAVLGTILLRKLSSNTIKRIFSLFMLWAAVRLIFR